MYYYYNYKYLIIFSTFLQAVVPSLCNYETNMPQIYVSGVYKLIMRQRPALVYGSLLNFNPTLTEDGFGPEFTVPVSRHHIIPYNTLRIFFNKLALRRQYYNIAPFWSSLGELAPSYFKLAREEVRGWEQGIQGVCKLLLGFRYNLITPTDNMSYPCPPYFDDFQSFYAWLPGNLFIGPRNRIDDPGDTFETNAAAVVGRRRFQILLNIYNLMKDYLDGSDDINWKGLTDDLVRVARFREPMHMVETRWIRTNDGNYYIINTTGPYQQDDSIFKRNVYYRYTPNVAAISDKYRAISDYYKCLEKQFELMIDSQQDHKRFGDVTQSAPTV